MSRFWKIFVVVLFILMSGCVFAQNADDKMRQEPDFGPYMRQLQRELKAKWNPPKDYITKRVVLRFTVHKDGTIDRASVYKSSGSRDADDAALKALYDLGKYRPLPQEFKGKSVDIQFTFDYNVFKDNVFQERVERGEQVFHPLNKNLYVVNREHMAEDGQYLYINALKLNQFTSNAYLYRAKIDCKNNLVGVKKTYAGSVNNSPYVLGLSPNIQILRDDVKMVSPQKDDDFLQIYNYVCEYVQIK